jgi:hypothetical protein
MSMVATTAAAAAAATMSTHVFAGAGWERPVNGLTTTTTTMVVVIEVVVVVKSTWVRGEEVSGRESIARAVVGTVRS